MPKRDIIVLGASAGGIEALRTLVSGLPQNFDAAVFIVMHTGPDSPGVLDLILQRASQLPCVTAHDKQRFEPGHIYVAKPDHHLLIEPARVCVSRGPKENRFRPAIDTLFRSAASVYGARVIGVVLTGGLDDGTAGLWAIKKLGGTAIVQDPDEALNPSMPLNALQYVDVDYVAPIDEIASLLVKLVKAEVEEQGRLTVPDNLDIELRIAKQDPAIDFDVRELWEATSYTCPDCHGVLLQLKEEDRERFRCHTGHAFSADSLLSGLTESIEESLWTTIRSIEESALLMRHLSKHLNELGEIVRAREFLERADEAQHRAEMVRRAVVESEGRTLSLTPQTSDDSTDT